MNKKILDKAKKQFQELSKKYNGFINVGFDNWRGFRFIFDTNDVRKCNNDCKNCTLYNLLKKERITKNSFGLVRATKEDKRLFGSQKFLNCKTLSQYENCFVNFILQKCKTKAEVKKELNFVKNFKIIFSKTDNPQRLEKKFKKSVMEKLARYAKSNEVIQEVINEIKIY